MKSGIYILDRYFRKTVLQFRKINIFFQFRLNVANYRLIEVTLFSLLILLLRITCLKESIIRNGLLEQANVSFLISSLKQQPMLDR